MKLYLNFPIIKAPFINRKSRPIINVLMDVSNVGNTQLFFRRELALAIS